MGLSSLFGPSPRQSRPTTSVFHNVRRSIPSLLLSASFSTAAFTSVTSSNLDISSLGRVALTGDFDAISLYEYVGQTEGSNSNGTQSVMAPASNGQFEDVASADAYVSAMCSFKSSDGKVDGIIVGGNFTSLGGIEAQGIALLDPSTGNVTNLGGLSGQVSALYCDTDNDRVYVGGNFKGANSTNAIAWEGSTGWDNLPFEGFNGPITSIAKAPSGHIVFGGSFSGLGNTTTPNKKNSQTINLSTANITTSSSTTTTGFSDPSNIVCKLDGTDGAGDSWLLADDTAGSWEASMGFGYTPTLLRLWNTHQDGRGTKTFRFTALPIDGIMNFTYTNPSTGEDAYCDATCPLSDDATEEYRDFTFVNSVGMNSFRIDISAWYGAGGGLDGIELFQDDIYAFAIQDFNEPNCTNSSFPSYSTTTGAWTVTPSGSSEAEYLTADVTSGSDNSVVFYPDLEQSGNYSVTIFTPGCIADDTCGSRGIVNVTGSFSTTTDPTSTQIYQTNDYEKYDPIYEGYVDASSSSFRPAVTLSVMDGGDASVIVASRVRFQLVSSTGGLNGLFEYNPSETTIDSSEFSSSAIDRAGNSLNDDAYVMSLVTTDDTIFAGGAFTDDVFENIMAFSDGNATSLAGNGLNAAVSAMYIYNDMIYIGGNFSDTSEGGVTGLSNVASYSIADKKWVALGAGLDGSISAVVPLDLNVTDGKSETTIAFSGSFTNIVSSSLGDETSVAGLAIWVPSQKTWLSFVSGTELALEGQLSASVTWSNGTLLAGSLSSEGLALSGAVALSGSSSLELGSLGIKVVNDDTSSSSKDKRDTASTDTNSISSVTGIVTGTYYTSDDKNLTIFGGRFTASATNGSDVENLLIIDGNDDDAITGLPDGVNANSTVLALNVKGSTLWAGGSISGEVRDTSLGGLVLYDLSNGDFASQVPALEGDEVVVHAIANRPSTSGVYVGGNFESAGSLSCPSVCEYDTSAAQWIRPGTGLDGTVTGLLWISSTKLIAAGNLTVNGNSSMLATLNPKKQVWSQIDVPTDDSIPGPITAMCAGSSDGSKIWISGTATNGSAYLIVYDGSTYHSIGDAFGNDTIIRGLQIMSVSKDHSSTNYFSSDQVLLITGQIDVPSFGNASAVIFNGSTIEPFVLSTKADGSAGSLSSLISENSNSLTSSSKHHSRGIVVLIALCCALGCIFLAVLAGFIMNRVQRQKAGYVPAPTQYQSNLDRVPPERLFSTLGSRQPGAPQI